MAGTTKTRTKPDRTFWQRLAGGLRRLLPPAWRGVAAEAVGIDDPGYPVHPLDLYDGLKGIQPAFYGMLAAWRRNCNGQPQRPQSQVNAAAHARELARLLELHNPYAQAIFSALRSYVLGEQGLTVEIPPRHGGPSGHKPTPTETAVQDWLDAWMDADDWWSRERELYVRCHRDGEGILRYFAARKSIRLRFVEPECVVAPDASPEWSEGVRTDPDDAETPESIWVQTGQTPADGEEVEASEVYFIKSNVDRCVKRGVSDFASCAGLLVKALDCLNSAVGAETIRQGVVMVTQHEESAPADLEAYISAQTDYTDRSHVYSSEGGPAREVPTQAVSPVREVHLTGAQKLAAPIAGSIDHAVNAVNTALLSAASRYHMPLWIVSGDASRNNALDLQAEGPYGKFVKDEQ